MHVRIFSISIYQLTLQLWMIHLELLSHDRQIQSVNQVYKQNETKYINLPGNNKKKIIFFGKTCIQFTDVCAKFQSIM